MKTLALCLLCLLIVMECNCEILFSMRRANRLVKKHISEKKLKYKHNQEQEKANKEANPNKNSSLLKPSPQTKPAEVLLQEKKLNSTFNEIQPEQSNSWLESLKQKYDSLSSLSSKTMFEQFYESYRSHILGTNFLYYKKRKAKPVLLEPEKTEK